MQISAGDQAAGVLKVQDESTFQGRRRFEGKETSGGHRDERPVKDCFPCGSHHDPRQRGFRDKHYFRSGRKGHATVKCHQVENTGEDDSDDEVHTVMCSVREGEKSAPVLCELEVQGEPVEFEIDAGSPYTIMGNDTVKRVFGCCVLDRSKVKIRSFTGRSVQLLGTREVNVKFRNRLVEARLTVTEYQHNLLGRDLTDKLGVLAINLVTDADTDIVRATLDRHPKLFQEELGKLKGVQAKVHVDGDRIKT